MNSDFFRLDLAGLDLWMNRGSSLIKSSSLCFFLSVLKSLQSRMSCSRKHSLRVKTEKRLIKGVEGSERQPVESKDERDIYGWHYLSNAICPIRPQLFCVSHRVKDRYTFAALLTSFEENLR